MKPGTTSRRVKSLLIELAAGTATVDGERIEIPRGEFDLLTHLAERPGDVFSAQELLQALWPGDAIVTDKELRNRVYKLRKRIGDHERDHKIVGNRPGFGYLIDLAPDAVQVVRVAAGSGDSEDQVIVLDDSHQRSEPETLVMPPAGTASDGAGSDDATAPTPEVVPRGRSTPRVATSGLVAATVASALLAGSWGLGNWLSQGRPAASLEVGGAPSGEATDHSQGDAKRSAKSNSSDGETGRRKNRTGSEQKSQETAMTTAAGTSSSNSNPRDDGGSSATTDNAERRSAPPQPDATLYHLFDPTSGDHYMTNNLSTATAKEADGYELSSEGRVFTSQVKGTVTIPLDSGRAYLYRDVAAAPKGVGVTTLFALARDGDRFYTVSSSVANEAQAQGWARSTAGYVAI